MMNIHSSPSQTGQNNARDKLNTDTKRKSDSQHEEHPFILPLSQRYTPSSFNRMAPITFRVATETLSGLGYFISPILKYVYTSEPLRAISNACLSQGVQPSFRTSSSPNVLSLTGSVTAEPDDISVSIRNSVSTWTLHLNAFSVSVSVSCAMTALSILLLPTGIIVHSLFVIRHISSIVAGGGRSLSYTRPCTLLMCLLRSQALDSLIAQMQQHPVTSRFSLLPDVPHRPICGYSNSSPPMSLHRQELCVQTQIGVSPGLKGSC